MKVSFLRKKINRSIAFMLKMFIITVFLVAFGVALLSVRLFWGKHFVHTDIKGNKAMEERGIKCAVEQELENQ
ncbi:MAG: hypothetical protein IKH52_03820 [Bacteroidaceae bacterium]|nr:hypothetical protein [Bacteroidaceae bacterium]